MGKISICDLCKKPLPNGLSDRDYKVTIKRRWWLYDGFTVYRQRVKLEICEIDMQKLIDVAKLTK